MQFRKYEFNSAASWTSVKNTLKTTKQLEQCSIVELGMVIVVPGTYDAMGREVVAPTYSTKYSVDILWHEDTIPSTMTQYEVWPEGVGCHTFSGLDNLYIQEYNKRK